MAYIHFLTDITDEQMEQISFFANVMHRDLTVLDDTDFRGLSAKKSVTSMTFRSLWLC